MKEKISEVPKRPRLPSRHSRSNLARWRKRGRRSNVDTGLHQGHRRILQSPIGYQAEAWVSWVSAGEFLQGEEEARAKCNES